jgi:hypothetical protein
MRLACSIDAAQDVDPGNVIQPRSRWPALGQYPVMENYDSCPKCAHVPLPADQALPAACPSCGLVLAKFRAREESDDEHSAVHRDDADDNGMVEPAFGQRLFATLLYVPERISPIAFWSRTILLVAFALWGALLIALDFETGEIMGSFLHGPLLIFHEAGHVLFGIFGEFTMFLGGSLAQLLMPTILAGALLFRHHDTFGAAIATWLLGVSLLDLAPYIYDSHDPQLVLLGGHTGVDGGHDWIYLLGETGLLAHARFLGALTHKVGALVIIVSIAWASWILMQQRRRGFVRGLSPLEM